MLSFMFVWDLPTIQEGTASLRTSRLRSFYAEVAPTCTVFGTLFGKALQAQVGTAPRCTLLLLGQQGLGAYVLLRSCLLHQQIDANTGLAALSLQAVPPSLPLLCPPGSAV